MFCVPEDKQTPLIMVGPGTGIVPFIGIIEDRELQSKNQDPSSLFGPSHLFFGCRLPDSDYIFKDKLEQAKQVGLLSELHSAFSRVMPASERRYVQDLMKLRESDLKKLIET